MRVVEGCEWAWDPLPDDVKPLLLLLDDTYSFITGSRNKNNEASYYDIVRWVFNEGGKEEYFFQQSVRHAGGNRARFISWVRAGMPGGYEKAGIDWGNEE